MEHNKILSVFPLSLGLFGLLSFVSISCFHLQITQTAYAIADSRYATSEIGDTDIGGSSEITSTPDNLVPISATFNEPMDGTTINSTTFIVRDSNGNNISGAISLGSDNRTATFTPLSPLIYSTEYIATINSGATDLAGNPLPADKAWSFFTPDVIDNQYEDIPEVSYYNTVDTNITTSEYALTNGTEKVAPFYSYPDQGQQQLINDNVSSSTSFLPERGQVERIERSLQPSAGLISSETANNFTGNLNQSFPAFTPLTNTQYNSITNPAQKGKEADAGFVTSQQADLGTTLALQPQQQYQSNLIPYQQYYQYPPQQLYQNQQFSYPSSNLTNNLVTDGVGEISSPLVPGTTTTLQQPPPIILTESLSPPDIIPPETYLVSAIDTNGLNVQSGAIVSSDLITITFEGIDDSGSLADYQCSYDGQPPSSCASPFIIDNSLALATKIAPEVSKINSHILLVSAVDTSGNIDQTPTTFIWSIGTEQEIAETVTSVDPLTSISPSTVPETEPTISPSDLSRPLSPPHEGYIPESTENSNRGFTIVPANSNNVLHVFSGGTFDLIQ